MNTTPNNYFYKRILVINSSNQFWGAENSLMIFLKHLDSHSFKLLIRDDGQGFDKVLDDKKIKYEKYDLELSPFKMRFYKSVLILIKELFLNKTNIIYANNEDCSSLLSLTKLICLFQLRTILHFRTTPNKYDYYKKLMFFHDDIICNSNFTKHALIRDIKYYLGKRIHIVPNSHGQKNIQKMIILKIIKTIFLQLEESVRIKHN